MEVTNFNVCLKNCFKKPFKIVLPYYKKTIWIYLHQSIPKFSKNARNGKLTGEGKRRKKAAQKLADAKKHEEMKNKLKNKIDKMSSNRGEKRAPSSQRNVNIIKMLEKYGFTDPMKQHEILELMKNENLTNVQDLQKLLCRLKQS